MNQLTTIPAHIANRQRRGLIDQASAGLGVSRPAHLSIRGGQFALVRSDGARYQLPTTYIDVVFCDALQETSRTLFAKYEPGSEDPPICFADNGVGPSKDALQPQSPLCETCWANERGSAQTFSGQDTSACRKQKKVAFFIPEDPQLNLYQYQIGPGTLGNFKAYCEWIRTQAGELDLADFVTRITQDPQKQFTFKFEAVGWADETSLQKLEYITTNNLSDAVVNRGDKPCDPEAVARMLQIKGSTAAGLPAPAQQFQLPPPVPHQAQAAAVAPAAFVPPTYPAQQAPSPQRQTPAPAQTPQAWPQQVQAVANQGWQPAPGQVAETRAPEAPKTRKPRTPKAVPADPVQAGAMAPAATQAQSFQAPGFVTQQMGGPGTRLQESAHVNPAPKFGMGQPGAAPQSLADAMNMLPPRQ